MAKLLSTIVNGFISSVNFISGLAGSGWRISMVNGKAKAEFDDLVIRNTMTVFELLISKVRAIRGAMGITQANGKIKSVREDEMNFYITIEEEMSFVANDIVRCLEFNGSKRAYWVTVSAVNGNEITVAKAEFANMSTPAAGDELVQFGNTTDKRRQSAIYLHADENGEPAIDVMFGIDKKSFDGCVKVRLGGDLPGTGGLKGFYSENGMIKGVDVEGSTVYCLYPDGTAELGAGAALFKPDKSGHIADGAISWEWDSAKQKYVCTMGDVILQWDNLSAEAKENLKGDPGTPGKDANLLPWVEDWDSNKMQIGADYLVSPKIFAGMNAGTADNPALTGVALGRGVITVNENGVEKQKSGIFGLKDGKITFSIDAETGEAMYSGQLNVNDNFTVDAGGKMTAKGASITGDFETTNEKNKVIISSEKNNIQLFQNGVLVGSLGFGTYSEYEMSSLELHSDATNRTLEITPFGIRLYDTTDHTESFSIDALGSYMNRGLRVNGWVRFEQKSINAEANLTSKDFIVLCKNTNDVTVYLPLLPLSGQIMYIRRCNARVTVHGNGYPIYRGTDSNTSRDLTNTGHAALMMWDDDSKRWYFNYLDI